jgi:hypothetical protein
MALESSGARGVNLIIFICCINIRTTQSNNSRERARILEFTTLQHFVARILTVTLYAVIPTNIFIFITN